MTILGLLIGCVGFITGVLGYQNEMVFPGTEALPTYQAILALVAGTLAIAIPFAALLHIMLRLLFKTIKPLRLQFLLYFDRARLFVLLSSH